MKLRKSY